MTDPNTPHPSGLGRVAEDAARAAEALQDLSIGPGAEAAQALEQAFNRAGRSIAGSLARAARDGEVSLKSLAAAALESFARTGFEQFLVKPMTGVIMNMAQNLPFLGARAGGGPVTAGGAYLVGEQGPEMFVPHGMGEIRPAAGGGGVTVHLHLPQGSDGASIQRSEQQIAAALARAAYLGQRSL
jgi:phage-related minor tail protein